MPWSSQVKEEQGRNLSWPERDEESQKSGGMRPLGVKTIETVVFVPSTPGLSLRKELQKADDKLFQAVNSPSVMFVKGGTHNNKHSRP